MFSTRSITTDKCIDKVKTDVLNSPNQWIKRSASARAERVDLTKETDRAPDEEELMNGDRRRADLAGLAAVIAIASLIPSLVAGQAPSAAAKPETTLRTPWGEPDLQGMWSTRDDTPFEAPNPDPKAAAIPRRRGCPDMGVAAGARGSRAA